MSFDKDMDKIYSVLEEIYNQSLQGNDWAEMVERISSYMPISELEEWVCTDDDEGDFVYIRVGEFGIVGIDKEMVSVDDNEEVFRSNFYIRVYVKEKASSEWIDNDWLLFCAKMREVGLPIEEGCLEFGSVVNGKVIYHGYRIL